MKKKQLKHFSASMITTYLLCPRKWYIRYILGERGPETPAMRAGTLIHKDIEEYFCREKDDLETIEAIEAKANGLLPPRESVDPRHVEYKASKLGLQLHGLPFKGFIDLPYRKEDGDFAIIDWKSRSRFNYCPDSAELQKDVQGRLYAWVSFELLARLGEHQETIDFTHGNLLRVAGTTKSPRSMEVTTTFERAGIYEWIDGKIKSITDEMKACATIDHPREVRQEHGSCFAYGPCEYKQPIPSLRGQNCYDIPYKPDVPTRTKKGAGMSMLSLLNKKKGSPKKEEKKAPEPGPKAEAGDGLARAKADCIEGKTNFDLLDYDLSHEEKREFILWRKERTTDAVQDQRDNPIPPVNPPDAAPDEEPVDLEDQTIFDFDFTGVDGVGNSTADNILEYLKKNGITDLVDLLDHNLKKIGGIGKKSEKSLKDAIKLEKNWKPEGVEEDKIEESKPIEKAVPDQEPIEKVVPDQGREKAGSGPHKSERTPATESTGSPSLASLNILYIDCAPEEGVQSVMLSTLLRPAKAQVAEETQMRYWSSNPYGKNRKILMDVILEDPAFLKGHVVARSAEEGMDTVLPEIKAFFDLIVSA